MKRPHVPFLWSNSVNRQPSLVSRSHTIRLHFLVPPTTMASTTSPPISILPEEILLLIAELLPVSSLLNLLRVNLTFHRVGLAVLLRPERSVNFLSTRTSNSHLPFNPCFSNKDYASEVRSVTVNPHAHHWCSQFDVPDMPKVDVIRLQLAEQLPDEHHWRILHSDVPTPTPFFGGPYEEPRCPLLNVPFASMLVVAETISYKKGIKILLPSTTVSSLRSTVLFLKAHQGYDPRAIDDADMFSGPETGLSWECLSRFMPDNIRSFTLVFESPQLDSYSWIGQKNDSAYGQHMMAPADELLTAIFDMCDDLGRSDKTRSMLPKGFETFTVVLPDGVLDSVCQKYFQDQVDLHLEQFRQKGICTVRIFSMTQLMGSKEYAGVMTEKEQEMWSERAHLSHYEMSIGEVQECINLSACRTTMPCFPAGDLLLSFFD